MILLKLQKLIKNTNITVHGFDYHTKASELYVDVSFNFPSEQSNWRGFVPYQYRRTGLHIVTEEELAEYLEKVYPYFSKIKMSEWIKAEAKYWNSYLNGKVVTKPFFDKLLNLEWNSIRKDFPANPNWARRIQDIKELGYTLATDTNRKIKGMDINGTHIMLLPIPKATPTGYEFFSTALKKRIISVLGGINVFEVSSANKAGLLPDHKFSEVRWDDKTKGLNPDSMTDAEIKQKFQLLDNQRNQQKREVCRNCFQTGKRGILYGIRFFYEGDENWAGSVKTGKDVEKFCVGCAWYDIAEWRRQLNLLIAKTKK